MATKRRSPIAIARAKKLQDAISILRLLDFGPRQSNDVAAYTLLALLDLKPSDGWGAASDPLRGITPIINFIAQNYGVPYAPNTRETIRDEAVKYFVESGMVIRNSDHPGRPINSGKTVYQVEKDALQLFQSFGSNRWARNLKSYEKSRRGILQELGRQRNLIRIAVSLPSGEKVALSPGGQNPLIKEVIEQFCPRFAPGATIVYIGDAEKRFLHLNIEYLANIGVSIAAAAKMPDVVIHDARRNWLLLVEAVTSAGPVDGKRRNELKELFSGCIAGLIFVTAFATLGAMRSFLTQVSWETEVWIAENPDHLIHFDGERFLGPYPDVLPSTRS
jgi:hypothetical protein